MGERSRDLIVWWLMGLTCILSAPSLAMAERAFDEARVHFERALDLEQEGELEEALAELERASELRPSFRLHHHMGRICRDIGLLADAYEHYELFLTDGGDRIEPDLRRQVTRALRALREELAFISINAPEGMALRIDGVPFGRTPLSRLVIVEPGQHLLELRLEGYRELRRDLSLAGGDEVLVDVAAELVQDSDDEVEPAAPAIGPTSEPEEDEPAEELGRRRPIHRGWFVAATATSAAALVAGAVFGGLALGGQDEFADLNHSDRSLAEDERARALSERGLGFATAADTLLSVGAVLAATAIVLAFFSDFAGDEDRTESDSASVSFLLLPGFASLSIP